MLFLALTMLGYISYQQLKMEIFPNAELPMLYVQINSRTEVTPEYMEQNGIIPVEGAIAGQEGINKIESTAGTKRGIIYISYDENVNIKFAYLKLSEKINSINGSMPEQFTLRVVKVDTEMQTNNLMSLQVRGSGGVDRVRNFVDQKITNELENIDGVAAVNVYGGQQKSVDIILNRAACDAYGISPSQIKSLLSRNMQTRVYSGKVNNEGKRYFVYVSADYNAVSDIENLVIGRGTTRLKDVAEVYYGEKEQTTLSRVNGKDAITMRVLNDSQANIIEVSHSLSEKIKELNEAFHPYDIEIIVQDDSAELMERNINEILEMAITGGLLAIFVLWIFLQNISLVLIVALAIPISIYSAFNFFYGFGITINSLTLVGIALAVGMLLDNSVVVLENIYRLKSHGVRTTDAIIKGTSEVWRSIFASTLTTITVFLPFIFSTNYMVKLLGRHIGVSIISTLSISLLVSLMLIPMVVNAIMKRKNIKSSVYRKVSLDNRGIRIYILLLKTALRNPVATIVTVLLIFFITIFSCLSVSLNKMQEVDISQVKVSMTMPTGSTLEYSDGLVKQLEERVAGIEEIEDVISNIGEEEADVTITLKENYADIHNRTLGEIKNNIETKIGEIPPATLSFGTSSGSQTSAGGGGGGGGARSSGTAGLQKMMGIGSESEYVVIRGQDFDLMLEVADFLNSTFSEMDEVKSSSMSVRENQPEVHVNFDYRLMSDYNLSLSEVSSELGSFQNEVSSGINFKQGAEEYEIMIKYQDFENEETVSKNKTLDQLRVLQITSQDTSAHELQTFADIYTDTGLREIQRINQTKEIEINYAFTSEITNSKELLSQARQQIIDVIDQSGIPAGIGVELVQEESDLDEFYLLIGIAILLIYMILAAVFESFITPLVLLFSIPLAALGSFLFLTITGNSLFNSNTLMGFLILLGVVVNNGILLIDFTNILRKRGYRKSRALLTSGLARIRPILITSVTTCVAMIPLAMGNTEYVKVIGAPFATTVIGGLSVSTLLTLIFIPTLYSGIESSLEWFKKLGWVIKMVLLLLIATGVYFSITAVDDFVWQLADILLVITGLPALLWFVSSSLRKTKTRIIRPDEKIQIRIGNLVKVYGRSNRFIREWESGKELNRRAVLANPDLNNKLRGLLWQIPTVAYLIYFNWFYLDQAFWQFFVAISTYLFILSILKGFFPIVEKHKRQIKLASDIFQYIFPLPIMLLLYFKWDNIGVTIVITIIWYLKLAVLFSSDKTRDYEHSASPFFLRWFFLKLSQIPGIGKRNETFKALKGVSFEIETGMFGLLGPNGAGKSTLMRIICGILDQSYGKIFINNHDTEEYREELQGLIGYLPQEFGMYENMTAHDYLDYQAMLKNIKDENLREERIKYVLSLVHMTEHWNQKISSFSGGMKQRIGIAQVLLHLPRILVVDEPTAGLDPRERIRFRNLLVELSTGRIVIFSTHIIEDISSSCNIMAVINKGEVIYQGTPRGMSEIAQGKVWNVILASSEFEEKTKDLLVLHHMRDGDKIRVRCLSNSKPFENAVEESALLEDAYIWLLRSKKISAHVNA